MSNTKKERVFDRVEKSPKVSDIALLKFINKRGLKGWELFAVHRGEKRHIFHFRKDIYYYS